MSIMTLQEDDIFSDSCLLAIELFFLEAFQGTNSLTPRGLLLKM